jgi:hypothetical protein
MTDDDSLISPALPEISTAAPLLHHAPGHDRLTISPHPSLRAPADRDQRFRLIATTHSN